LGAMLARRIKENDAVQALYMDLARSNVAGYVDSYLRIRHFKSSTV
jgi:hypothetical protein